MLIRLAQKTIFTIPAELTSKSMRRYVSLAKEKQKFTTYILLP